MYLSDLRAVRGRRIPLRFILHVVDKEEVIRLIKENYEEIKKFGVKKIGIFGSVARGEAREDSDVDILVVLSEPIGLRIFDLKEFLESILGKEVDLVSEEAISPYIRPYIEEEVVFV